MGLFDFFRPNPKPFFSTTEKEQILEAVRRAEKRTSGEVRVYVENKCRFVDALDRAAEMFFSLKMEQTQLRNAVVIYIALKDKQVAIFGDEGIHQKVTTVFWKEEVAKMLRHFSSEHIAQGIVQVTCDIGEVLYQHFPYDEKTDKNELPDDIVFGK